MSTLPSEPIPDEPSLSERSDALVPADPSESQAPNSESQDSESQDSQAPESKSEAPRSARSEILESQITDPREDRYECRSCGYDYEPLKGDDRRNIPPNTPFMELDRSWRCPVCSAPKVQFKNIGPKGKPSGFKENLGYGLGVNVMTPGQKNILIFGALAVGFLFFMSLYGLG